MSRVSIRHWTGFDGQKAAMQWRGLSLASLGLAILTAGCGGGGTSLPSVAPGTRAAASIDFGGKTSELCFMVAITPVLSGAVVSITVTPSTGLIGPTTVSTITDSKGEAIATWPILAQTSADWSVEATITTPTGPLTATATGGTTSSGEGPESPACPKN